MHFLKRLTTGLFAFLLSLCLAGMVASTVFNATVGKPANIKDWLDKNNVYGAAVNSTIDRTLKDAAGSGSTLNQPEVQDVIKKTFTPALAKSITEEVIDGTSDWLSGQTDKPSFIIDLTPVKQTLAEESGNALVNRLNNLPVCTTAQLREITPDTDPFTIPCRPAGIDINGERQKIVQEILNNKELFADPIITADTIKTGDSTEPFYKNLGGLPGIYRLNKKLPWVFGLLSVLLATGIVFMSDTKRKGLSRVARSLMTSGIFLIITVVIVNILTRWLSSNKNLIKEASADLQSALLGVGNSVAGSINMVLLAFGIAFIMVGGGVLVYLYKTKPKEIVSEASSKPSDSQAPKS